MKKLILLLILCSLYISAQKKLFLNKHDYKIQLYGGMYSEFFSGDYKYIVGGEASYKHHNIGIYTAEKVESQYNLFYGEVFNTRKANQRVIGYYGWRVSNKCVSTSLNIGTGTITYTKPGKHSLIYQTFPCAEIMCKSNFSARANGIGIILVANFNPKQILLDARCVMQLGYEWSWKKRKDKMNGIKSQ